MNYGAETLLSRDNSHPCFQSPAVLTCAETLTTRLIGQGTRLENERSLVDRYTHDYSSIQKITIDPKTGKTLANGSNVHASYASWIYQSIAWAGGTVEAQGAQEYFGSLKLAH